MVRKYLDERGDPPIAGLDLRQPAGEARLVFRRHARRTHRRQPLHRPGDRQRSGGDRERLAASARRNCLGGGAARPPGAGPAEREFLPPSGREADDHRNHRHQRQDHDVVHPEPHVARRRTQDRAGRHRRVPHRERDFPRSAHHARSSRTEPDLLQGGELRMHRSGAGSFLARARAAAHFRNSIRRGGVHQPHARSSRLSRDDGELLRVEDHPV